MGDRLEDEMEAMDKSEAALALQPGDRMRAWWASIISIPVVVVEILADGKVLVERSDVETRPRYTVRADTLHPPDWRP